MYINLIIFYFLLINLEAVKEEGIKPKKKKK